MFLLSFAFCFAVPAETAADVSFQRDVAPLIEQHCIRCHKPGNTKGDLSLASRAGLAESGLLEDVADNHLLQLISGADGDRPEMPKEGEPLKKSEVELFRKWIQQGAKWPKEIVLRERAKGNESWWSLQPISVVEPERAKNSPAEWNHNSIDRFVFQKLTERKLRPNARASRRTLIRRATYDLTGLPPTPEAVAAFVGDETEDAWPKLIDRLLESPRYGERWGRHWLDVVRFGESRGFERNEIINNIWPFRDYVIRSINEDKRFDEFIREHLAGDLIGSGDPNIEIATAFLVGGPYDDVGNSDAKQAAQIRANTIDEMIRTTSEAFLGLTVGCARCHDHKFDAIRQADYYGYYATFAGVRHGSRPITTPAATKSRAAALAPLNAEKRKLAAARDKLNADVMARANTKAAQHSAKWVRPAPARQRTEETFPETAAKFVRFTVEGTEGNPSARSGYRIDEFEVWSAGADSKNVALATNGAVARGASRVAGDFDGAYGPDLTIDGRFGACWIASGPELTIEFRKLQRIDRVVFSSDRPGAAPTHGKANLACEYRLHVSKNGTDWVEVANSYDRKPMNAAQRNKRLADAERTAAEKRQLAELGRQIRSIDNQIRKIPAPQSLWIGNHVAAKGPFHLFVGGDPQRRGEVVKPTGLSSVAKTVPYQHDAKADAPHRRRELADWITDRRNPLPVRVLANRIWHYHFGTGIVDTPSDFGYMGGRPSHPELLDWLSQQLQAKEWRLKPMHRLIMMSQTYQQASHWNEKAAAVDVDARLLWRFNPRRLSAEEIRDTVLAVSGKLNFKMGGPGFRLYRYLQDNVATYVPMDQVGPESYRRAIYHQNARASQVDLMTEFDRPDCAFSSPRRGSTTTPLQALTMLNHSFTMDMAQALSERLTSEADSVDKQLNRAWQLCYSRDPTDQELQRCRAFVTENSLRALARVLLNTSELIYVK